MKGFVFCSLVVLIMALSACGSSTTAAPPTSSPTPTLPTSHYSVKLSALNGSGVSGIVDLQLTGNMLTVTVNISGLTPSQIHFQHIHGSHDVMSTCPTKADANASGIITVDRTLQLAGPVAFSFSPYTPADGQGVVRWSNTFTLDSGVLWDISSLTQHVVVVHGMMYQGSYNNVLPVACGPILAM